MCDGAAAAGGGTRLHPALLKALEVTLKARRENDTLTLWSRTNNQQEGNR